MNENDIENLLNISKTRAYEISKLILKKDLIQKEGVEKNTYYVIKNDFNRNSKIMPQCR